MIGRQPPVYSPVGMDGIRAALRAVVGRSGTSPAMLEARLLERFAGRRVVLADSGTSALVLAIRAAHGGRPGGRVALPAWGCYDLATAALGAGATVAFYDLIPHSLRPDPQSVVRLTGPLDAVVGVHFFGLPTDLTLLGELARRTGASLIEDAAQAVGLETDAGPAGMTGDFGILSFGRGKGHTGGGGGALLVRGPESIPAQPPRGTSWASVVKLAAQWALGRPPVYELPARIPGLRLGETVFHLPWPPRGMSEGEAAVVLATWEAAVAAVAERRSAAAVWKDALAAVPGVMVPEPADPSRAGWLRVPILVPDSMLASFDSLGARRHGVFRAYPRTLSALPGLQFDPEIGPWPGAEQLACHLFTAPTHRWITDAVRRSFVKLVTR